MSRFCVLLLFVSVPLLMFAADEPRWFRIQSQHFNVITSAGEKQGRETALKFELVRNAFGILLNKSNPSQPVPLQIIVVTAASDSKQTAAASPEPASASSFYLHGEDRNFIMLDLSSPTGINAVYSEYARSLVDTNFPRMQPWFDEGVAALFSGIEPAGKSTSFHIPFPGTLDDLRQINLSLVPLFNVKSVPISSPEKSQFQMQSWLVVRYIVENKLMPQLGDYFGLVLNQKLPVDQAISQAFGSSPKELESKILAHLQHSASYSVPTPENFDPNKYVVTRLANVDPMLALADLKAHMPGREDEAVAEFESVTKVALQNPGAYQGLGYINLRRDDLEHAAVNLKRAVDLGSTDARSFFLYALLLRRQNGSTKWLQMRTLLKRALELEPNYADAYALLAFADDAGGQFSDAIRWMKQAIALSPRNDRYRLDLARYMLSDQRGDSAKALLSYLSTSPDSSVASDAASLLKQVESVGVAQFAKDQEFARNDPMAYIDPRWKPKSGKGTISELDTPRKSEEEAKPDLRKIEFLKGRVVKIDCSSAPAASLTVAAAGKTWTMRTADREKLVLVGADKFSCEWSNRTVAVNYKIAGPNLGELVSLEVQ